MLKNTKSALCHLRCEINNGFVNLNVSATCTRGELLEIGAALNTIKLECMFLYIYIRIELFNVVEAVIRSLSHTSSHIGHVIYIAKQVTAEGNWTTLSIPRKRN